MLTQEESKKRRCCPLFMAAGHTYDEVFASLSTEGQQIMNAAADECVHRMDDAYTEAVAVSTAPRRPGS